MDARSPLSSSSHGDSEGGSVSSSSVHVCPGSTYSNVWQVLTCSNHSKWVKLSLQNKLEELFVLADKKGYKHQWNKIMTPWLKHVGITVTDVSDGPMFDVQLVLSDVIPTNTPVANMMKSIGASEPQVCAIGGGRGKYHEAEADVPQCEVIRGSASGAADVQPSTSHPGPKKLEDLVSNLRPGKPAQELTYSREHGLAGCCTKTKDASETIQLFPGYLLSGSLWSHGGYASSRMLLPQEPLSVFPRSYGPT